MEYPSRVGSIIEGEERLGGMPFAKTNPATGADLGQIVAATDVDIDDAIRSAAAAFDAWNAESLDARAGILSRAVDLLMERRELLATVTSLETGRSLKHAIGEVDGAIKGARYLIEHRDYLQPRPIESAVPGRKTELRRSGVGAGAVFAPFNNPASNAIVKLFPPLLCGDAVIVKAHELTPYTPIVVAKALLDAGVPAGALAVVQGGRDVGARIVADQRIAFVSFTGSTAGGVAILAATAPRLARVSIEAGGKNPFVVCDDADLEKAATAAASAAFVDSGQRCAATSRIIIFDAVYDAFTPAFVERAKAQKIGTEDGDDYGAIISAERLAAVEQHVADAVAAGATPLLRGARLDRPGYFLSPTIFENVPADAELSRTEVFGPVVILYRVRDLTEAIQLANASPFRLSSAIHTKNSTTAEAFITAYHGGVVRVNGPTHGSEPHMPFGGEGLSGNGWREPGLPALDFYSSLKQVSVDPA